MGKTDLAERLDNLATFLAKTGSHAYAELVREAIAALAPTVCSKCDGCGQVANTDAQEPWKSWLELPLQSSAAVLMGLVKPMPCPACSSAGASTHA